MPAAFTPPGTRTLSVLQSPGIPYWISPPPFLPPFADPTNTNNNNNNNVPAPFQTDPSDRSDGTNLPPGIIAAIVIPIFAFFLLVTGLFAFLHYRRQKAKRDEIARKEEGASATADHVTVSGALDPPPPYDEVHDARPRAEGERRWEHHGDVSGSEEEEEDSEAMGSHATITDGLDPGRHRDRSVASFPIIPGCGII
ncbi:3b7d9f8c-992d-4a4a-937a-2f3bee80c4aa [Thermothielavioides terrestris]|uniref:3b7d9f8c-992d-4a4a-937a-2f3bee80c4aa n=1 Tax=Thermothielavioides terrestris TaxID=2587410 RepID=A0A446BN87_9PEZI|nr:3b7d9f8c-992d-4a4a-937a-2f3bee80c4aa [Thermothielavioides terrestris]